MMQVKDLSFAYHKKKVFNELNIAFDYQNDKRRYAVIGPNGCGKSTLLKLLGGHLKPDGGQVLLKGKELSAYGFKERAREMSLIMQNAKFEFPFTCFDIVLMGRNPHKNEFEDYRTVDIEAAKEAVKMADVGDFAMKPITEVSGGEFQRVLLARAMAQEPKFILLDEAFSAMDIQHKKRALEILSNYVKEKDAYLLMIMHDINFAYRYSDQVVMMKDGEVVNHGITKDTLTETSIGDVFNIGVKYVEDYGFLLI